MLLSEETTAYRGKVPIQTLIENMKEVAEKYLWKTDMIYVYIDQHPNNKSDVTVVLENLI